MKRFRDIRKLRSNTGKRYYINTILPEIPLSQDDDRLDNLSFEFYNDVQYWWVILAANPNKLRKDSYHVVLGEQIRIPADPVQYVNRFTGFNNNNR